MERWSIVSSFWMLKGMVIGAIKQIDVILTDRIDVHDEVGREARMGEEDDGALWAILSVGEGLLPAIIFHILIFCI